MIQVIKALDDNKVSVTDLADHCSEGDHFIGGGWDAFFDAVLQSCPDVSDIVIRNDGRYEVVSGRGLDLGKCSKGLLFRDLIKELPEALGMDAVEDLMIIGAHRFRVSLTKNSAGMEIVMRILPKEIPSPDDLLVPKDLTALFLRLRMGLVFLAGPTGSGKSTTIAGLVQAWARQNSGRIVTLEDPIEYFYPDFPQSSVSQRQVGKHCASFGSGLSEALRMKPDVIAIQEVRSQREAMTAVSAALSGHLVVTTMHGERAHIAVQRFLDLLTDGPDGGLSSGQGSFASAFRACVCQRIVFDGSLSRKVPLHEILLGTEGVKNSIRAGNFTALRQAIEVGGRYGMQTFDVAFEQRKREGFFQERGKF